MKKLKHIFCLGLSFAVLGSHLGMYTPVFAQENQSAPLVEGITDYFDFEAETGKAVDSKMNSNIKLNFSGTSAGLSDEQAVFGKSLKFGGNNNNKAVISNYLNSGTASVSFSLWYKHNNAFDRNSGESSVLLQQTGNGKTLLARKANGKLFTYIYARDVESRGTIPENTWTHIAVTFNLETKKGKFYINGTLDSEVDLGTNLTNAMTDLRIGAHKADNNAAPHPMRGLLDDLYIFKAKVLTEDEVRALYRDKALPLQKINLNQLIVQGTNVVEANTLPAENTYFVALNQALSEARTVAESQSVDNQAISDAENRLTTALANYQAALPIEIHIDPNTVEKNIDAKSIFGINHRYAFNGYGTFDSTTKQVKEDFKNLYKQANFGSIRYPGGTISNLFNWKTARGSADERKHQIHGFYNYDGQGGIAPHFGLPEIGSFSREMGSEMVYVYSLARGDMQDVADLAEYLNAKVGVNFNGGIDWAAVRAAEGHVEPFNVRYFEMGNEMNQGGQDGRGSQQYWLPSVEGKNAVQAYIEGGIASFRKQYAVKEEDWNKVASVSDGTPNMKRYMRYANINPRIQNESGALVNDPAFKAVQEEGLAVFVGRDNNHEEWTKVEDFTASTATDKHYKVDFSTGAIIFGDGEQGMIPAQGQQIYVTYKVEKAGFIKLSRALKEAMQAINQAQGTSLPTYVYTSYEHRDFINKMTEMGMNDYYDGMSIHPYSGRVTAGSDVHAFYDEAMKKAEASSIAHVRTYAELLPAGKVPVISEFGIFRNTEPQVRSLTHALYIAKSMLEFVRLGSPYIQKHALVDWYSPGADALGPTQQAVIQAVAGSGADTRTGEGPFTFFSTPSAHVFQMLNHGHFGNQVIQLNVASHSAVAQGVTPVTALASKDAEGNVYVALVNVDRQQARTVSLSFADANEVNRTEYRIEQQTLNAASVADENTPDEPHKILIDVSSLNLDELSQLTLPAHSFTVLSIKVPVQAPKNEIVFLEEERAPQNAELHVEPVSEEAYSSHPGLSRVTEYKVLDLSLRNKLTKEPMDYSSDTSYGRAKVVLLKEEAKEVKQVLYLNPDQTHFEERTIVEQDDTKVVFEVDHLSTYALLYSERAAEAEKPQPDSGANAGSETDSQPNEGNTSPGAEDGSSDTTEPGNGTEADTVTPPNSDAVTPPNEAQPGDGSDTTEGGSTDTGSEGETPAPGGDTNGGAEGESPNVPGGERPNPGAGEQPAPQPRTETKVTTVSENLKITAVGQFDANALTLTLEAVSEVNEGHLNAVGEGAKAENLKVFEATAMGSEMTNTHFTLRLPREAGREVLKVVHILVQGKAETFEETSQDKPLTVTDQYVELTTTSLSPFVVVYAANTETGTDEPQPQPGTDTGNDGTQPVTPPVAPGGTETPQPQPGNPPVAPGTGNGGVNPPAPKPASTEPWYKHINPAYVSDYFGALLNPASENKVEKDQVPNTGAVAASASVAIASMVLAVLFGKRK